MAIGSMHPDRQASAHVRWIEVDGIRTRYYEDGDGPPLVLLHGGEIGFIDSLDTWSLNLDELAREFHVYAVDKLGQGFTDPPASDDGYTYDATLRHALGWIDAVGIPDGAHVVGHSRGGLLAASILFERPQLATSAIIVDSATLAPDPDDPRLQSGRFYAEVDRRTGTAPATLDSLRIEPEMNSYSMEHVTDEYLERYLEIARLPGQRRALEKMRGGLNERLFLPNIRQARAEALRRIDQSGMPVPTLLVWGRNDPSAPLAEVGIRLYERIAARTPTAEMHVFNHAGHYTYREQAAGFNRLVGEWCRSVAPSMGR